MAYKIKMGWRKQNPDHRDYRITATPEAVETLPPSVDLRRYDSPIKDQGSQSSCTANAVTELFEWYEIKKTGKYTAGSRDFNYWYSRKYDHIVGDQGATIRSACKVLGNYGVPPESIWGYSSANVRRAPTTAVKAVAKKAEARKYYLLDGASTNGTLQNLKVALQTLPAAIGFTCYNSVFSPPSSGIIALPKGNEAPIGGHAVEVCGYEDAKQALLARNSWGVRYALKGYFYIPYWYVLNDLVSDCWCVPSETQIDHLSELHYISEGGLA